MVRKALRKVSIPVIVALLGVTASSIAAQAAPTPLNWGRVNTAQSPPAREFGAMSFDSARNRTVLFGGGNQAFADLNDTWEFDGATWVQRTPATSPPAMVGSAMAYVAAAKISVLFGGATPSGFSSSTWEWDGTNWALHSFSSAIPSGRVFAMLAFDPYRGQVILFGGEGPGGVDLGDTWSYDGTRWTRLAPASSPSPRWGSGIAFDSVLGRVVLFGGRSNGQRLADTWTWDGTNWAQVPTTSAPFARFWTSMAFDPEIGRVVLFGGDHIEPYGLGPTNDTWEFDGFNWIQDWTAAVPMARAGMAMAQDANGRVAMFGGSDEGNPGVFPTDTGELGTGIVTPAGNPALTFNPTKANFALTSVGSTSSAGLFNVWNSGTGPLVATISTTGDFAVAGTTCPSAPNPFAVGYYCKVFVTFTPTAVGDRSGSLVFTDTTTGASYSVPLTGTGGCCDFFISAAPGSLTIGQGTSATDSITTNPIGTAATVALSAQTTDPGVTATFNPVSITAGGGSTMTVSVASNVVPGSYGVTVTGTEGTITRSAAVSVTVVAGTTDFSIAANPASVTVTQGSDVTSAIGTAVTSGSAATVSLSASVPAGLTATLQPSSVTAGGGSTLIMTASATIAPGPYTVTVTGTEGSSTHSVGVTVNVVAAPSDFTLSADPAGFVVLQGDSRTSTISTTFVTGSADAINLSVSSSPAGLAAALNPTVVTAGGGSTLTVSPDYATAPGNYTLTVTGIEGSSTHSVAIQVTVTARDFSISGPGAFSIVQGSSAAGSVSTTVIGGPATVALTASSSPGGLSVSLNPASVTAGGSSVITVSAAYTTPPGTYTVTVTGIEGSNTHSTSFGVTVTMKGLDNRGFESGDLGGWSAAGNVSITNVSHSGAFAAQMGSTTPSTDSTLSQTFTVPASGGKLLFWYRMSCGDKVKTDWFTATLRDNVTGATSTVQAPVCTKMASWTKVTVNVSAQAGHSVTLTFLNHDDGRAGDPTYTLVDDVSLA